MLSYPATKVSEDQDFKFCSRCGSRVIVKGWVGISGGFDPRTGVPCVRRSYYCSKPKCPGDSGWVRSDCENRFGGHDLRGFWNWLKWGYPYATCRRCGNRIEDMEIN